MNEFIPVHSYCMDLFQKMSRSERINISHEIFECYLNEVKYASSSFQFCHVLNTVGYFAGRLLLPTLEFWRNQKAIYDAVCDNFCTRALLLIVIFTCTQLCI